MSTTMQFTDPNLPSINHIRDIGKSINQFAGRKLSKEGVLYISSSIQDASPTENEYLRNTLGIRTVVDTTWESDRTHVPTSQQPQPQKQQQQPSDPKQDPRARLHINRNLGLTYCGVKWRRGPYIDQMISELSLWQRTKMFGSAVIEDYPRAVALLTNVASNGGATKDSLRVLDASKGMIGDLWNGIFGQEASYPILMVGNRDSSLFVMVLLIFLEIPIEVISKDIEQSIVHVQSTAEPPADEASARFLEDFMRSAGTWAEDVERWLQDKFRGVDGYLAAAGITTKAQDAVEGMLLVDSDEKLVEV